ncbi:hypothetical protein [Spongiimicrobium salis]|uniref:hypothetical protein n=1 Tax=Spongiimicrobium salis TaxID=1667022 RepID=UPI00374D8588
MKKTKEKIEQLPIALGWSFFFKDYLNRLLNYFSWVLVVFLFVAPICVLVGGPIKEFEDYYTVITEVEIFYLFPLILYQLSGTILTLIKLSSLKKENTRDSLDKIKYKYFDIFKLSLSILIILFYALVFYYAQNSLAYKSNTPHFNVIFMTTMFILLFYVNTKKFEDMVERFLKITINFLKLINITVPEIERFKDMD